MNFTTTDMSFVAYKTTVQTVNIDGRLYEIEEKHYITDGGFTSHFQNATKFTNDAEIPHGYLVVKLS